MKVRLSLYELSDLITGERWGEAAAYAQSLVQEFYYREQAENDKYETKLLHWRRIYMSPSDRVWRVMIRLCRDRLIYAEEANELIDKLSRKYSRAPWHTARSLELKPHRDVVMKFLWRGRRITQDMPNYKELMAEARENGWQFCDLKKHKQQRLDWLYCKEIESLQLKYFINQTQKEITRHVKNT